MNFEVKYLMKKVISVFLIALMLCSVVGCGSDETENSKPSNDGTTSNDEQIEYEKPYEGNAAILPMQMHSPYDNQAEALRKEIIDLPDTLLKNKNIYYVSYRAKQGGDGKSPETAWNSLAFIDIVPEGSTILFERGGVYREKFELKSNMSYGAYGKGVKPCIYGSVANFADEALWKEESKGIWVLQGYEVESAGGIIFDHGKDVGIFALNSKALISDLTFCTVKGKLKLRCDKGNPGALYDSIEVNDKGHIIYATGYIENVVIENLCVKYGGEHGISINLCKNVKIRGCEIGYIGGCVTDYEFVRYGNGIQFWRDCDGVVCEKNWIYQCYDAGLTHQTSSAAVQKNINFSKNLIEYCVYNIEAFNEHGKTENVTYKDNILRFAGYGCFDPKSRLGSNSSAVSHICLWRHPNPGSNFKITGNIFDTSYRYLIYGYYLNEAGKNATVSGNTYVQQPLSKTYAFDKDNIGSQVSVTQLANGTVLKANDLASLTSGVKAIDTSPKKIQYVK